MHRIDAEEFRLLLDGMIIDEIPSGSNGRSGIGVCGLVISCGPLIAFGFRLVRIQGSHHLYSHPDVDKLVNLQEVGGQAKPYQVRQFLKLVERYGVRLENR